VPPIPPDCRAFKPAKRERVRHALAKLLEEALRQDSKVVSIARVRAAAGGGDQNSATALLRAWRAGELSVADSWEQEEGPGGEAARDELAEALAAKDPERVRAAVASRVARGELEAAAARVVLDACAADAPAGAVPLEGELEDDDVDLERQEAMLATREAMQVAKAFDLMVSDERRARIATFVARELDQDVTEHPNLDRGGAR
jgi:hypothetical protein